MKITFLQVLDYSEYSKISNFFFHENIASSVRKQKRIIYCKNSSDYNKKIPIEIKFDVKLISLQ